MKMGLEYVASISLLFIFVLFRQVLALGWRIKQLTDGTALKLLEAHLAPKISRQI